MRLIVEWDTPAESKAPGVGAKLAKAVRDLLTVAATELPEAERPLCKGALDAAPEWHGDGEVHVLAELATMMSERYDARLADLRKAVAASVRA